MKRSNSSVMGVLFLVIYTMLGIFLIVNPTPSGEIVCSVLAGVLGVVGIVKVINYFKMDEYEALLRKELAMGMLFILVAFVVVMLRKKLGEDIIPMALSIVLIYEAMGLLQYAVDFARGKVKYWYINLISGSIVLVLGILSVFVPFSDKVKFIFLGSSFLAVGVATIVSMFLLRIFRKEYAKKNEVVVASNK